MTIAFGLRSENLPDRFQEHLTFVLTEPSGKTFTPTVTLTGKVLREVTVNPAFVDFGTVLLVGVTTRTISMKSLSGQTFAIEDIEASHEVEVSSTASADNELQVQVSFKPRERPGWREGKIKFRLSGLRRKEVSLPFKAIVDGVVDTDPNFLNFGLVKPGQSKILTFRIVNRSRKQISLQLKSKTELVKVTPTSKDGLEWSAILKVPTSVSSSQILSGKIVFTTSVPIQPNLEVPFFAAVEDERERQGREEK